MKITTKTDETGTRVSVTGANLKRPGLTFKFTDEGVIVDRETPRRGHWPTWAATYEEIEEMLR